MIEHNTFSFSPETQALLDSLPVQYHDNVQRLTLLAMLFSLDYQSPAKAAIMDGPVVAEFMQMDQAHRAKVLAFLLSRPSGKVMGMQLIAKVGEKTK